MQTEPLLVPSGIIKGDIEGGRKEALENGKKGLSLSASIVEALKIEPDRPFVVRDLVDPTGGNYASVKRELARLSSTGKGSGPVRRVRHGMYQYDPCKEEDSLKALVQQSDNWKVENMTFVSFGAQGGIVPHVETILERSKETTSERKSKPGYPKTLPTGQQIQWELDCNDTETVRLAANKRPPFSPDHALTLIQWLLLEEGSGRNWHCISIEANIDSRKLRVDSSHSITAVNGLLLKVYQHGPSVRVEIANRRKCSIKEVWDLLHTFTCGYDGTKSSQRNSRDGGATCQS